MEKLVRVTTVSYSLNTLLRGQLAFLSKFYNVIGVASDDGTLEQVSRREKVKTISVTMRRDICLFQDVRSLGMLIRLFIKERPFIVHSNTPKASLLSMIAAWITRVPHRIYTVTGLRFETAIGKLHWLLIIMEKITCWCATKVIPEGEGVKRTLIANRITNKPLNVISNGNINGIDVDYYSRSEEVMLGVTLNSLKSYSAFTFIFVGRMVKDKGINELIYSFVKLSCQYTDIRLFLVGDFERDLDPLDSAVEELILNNKLIFAVGFQNDVRPYFAAADVLVFPSYREGFPNVVLQAGAMELPSIVTDINGCNEIIQDSVNGKIVPSKNVDALYDAMKWFYEHRNDEVKVMAKNARPMIVERYEQHKVWEALLEEYRSLDNNV